MLELEKNVLVINPWMFNEDKNDSFISSVTKSNILIIFINFLLKKVEEELDDRLSSSDLRQ